VLAPTVDGTEGESRCDEFEHDTAGGSCNVEGK
jgi:hypothetical protein